MCMKGDICRWEGGEGRVKVGEKEVGSTEVRDKKRSCWKGTQKETGNNDDLYID